MAKPFQRKTYTSDDANTWERTFGKILTPFEQFVESSSGSGILLLVLTVVAMVIANSPWNESYQHFIHQHLAISFSEWRIDLSLHHWVNDALMAIFFFIVGLEIKHEIIELLAHHPVVWVDVSLTEGVRRTVKDASRPVLAAEDPAQRYQQLLDERTPLYREVSGYRARTDGRTPQQVVADVLNYLETHSDTPGKGA